MFKKFLWIAAFISSLIFNQVVIADSSVCRESLHRMIKSINLDEAQKAKIKPILDQLRSKLQASGSQMNKIEQQINQQTNSENMDQDKVNNLVDNQTKLIGDMIKAKIIAKNQIFSILNPQQKEKLQGMIKKSDEKIAAEFKKCEDD